MTIFTKEAKEEVKRFLPHYIVGSAFIIASILVANLVSSIVSGARVPEPQSPPPMENEAFSEDTDAMLPSQYVIGKPYNEAIEDKSKPLIIEFFADWCPYSKKLTPVMAEVSNKFTDANFTSVDTQVETNYYLSKKYNVDKFPLVIVVNPKTNKTEELDLDDNSFVAEGLTEQLKELVNKVK